MVPTTIPRSRAFAGAIGGLAFCLLSSCAPVPAAPTPPEFGHEASALPVLLEHPVQFETDSPRLSAREARALDAFLDTLGRTPDRRIVVLGRADERAGDAYNLALSARRADAVAAEIRARGFREVSLRALGEEAPLASGSGEQAWRQNRRATVLVVAALAGPLACPDWSGNLAYDPSNATSSNFGCATAANLAQMVADPLDLAGTRTLGGADASREADAVRRYRDGKVQPLLATGSVP